MAARFEALGARVLLGARAESVTRADPRPTGWGRIHGGEAVLEVGGSSITVDEVVVAAGRVPTTRDLGLDTIGLSPSGYLEVDDQLGVRAVSGEWLYAVGDVNGRALLTHMGKYQARVAGAVIAARAEGRPLDGPLHRDVADHGLVPQVAFTDPQVASVGRSEQEARDAGVDVEAVEYDLGAVAGSALLRDGYTGRAKLVLDRGRGTLVGATFVGPEVAELVHAATVAVVGEVPLAALWHAVPAYPTVSEIWLRLLETWRDRQEGRD